MGWQDPDVKWIADMRENNWRMPSAPRWKRLPVIRHIRWFFASIKVRQHERFYTSLGLLRTGYDQWVLYGIFKGYEE